MAKQIEMFSSRNRFHDGRLFHATYHIDKVNIDPDCQTPKEKRLNLVEGEPEWIYVDCIIGLKTLGQATYKTCNFKVTVEDIEGRQRTEYMSQGEWLSLVDDLKITFLIEH